MPTPVDELKARDDADFPVSTGTNEESVLRFLAANPELGWTPPEVADRTDVSPSGVSETLQRLLGNGLVDRVEGVYFVKQERLVEIRGVLGDLHGLREMGAEPEQEPVHPDETLPERDVERAVSEADVDEFVRNVLEDEE